MEPLEFVYEPLFDRSAKGVLAEDDLMALEEMLCRDPRAGDVIPDTGGARKVRIPLSGRGKRGGGRAIYVYIEMAERIYLLLCYPKNVQGNLTSAQKAILRQIIAAIRKELER
jgi:hypothetical protein